MKLRVLVCSALSASLAMYALAQSEAGRKFEVVSVKVASKESTSHPGRFISPGRLADRNVSMRELIEMAFHVERYQIVGPGWTTQLDDFRDPANKYDIEAPLPKGVGFGEIREMYRSLLIDRFQLTYHREKCEMKGYTLSVDKRGPKLSPSSGPKDTFIGSAGPGLIQGDPMTMEALAKSLTSRLHFPVVDKTNIDGEYKIHVEFVPDNAPPGTSGPSVFAALKDELGLILTAEKLQVDCVVVDHVNRIPTPN